MSDSLQNISEKLACRERLTLADGFCLFKSNDILKIGKLAQEVRTRLHGKRVYYSVNLHLNHTNICSARCDFCAFSRDKDEPDAYAFSPDEIEERIGEAIRKWNINEVHMVGGHNPSLNLDYYAGLFRRIRQDFPQVYIKALSAPEVDDLAKRSGIPAAEVLRILKEAGLESLPGGGAEIFEPRVRRKICPQKITGERWLEIHRTAHKLGFSSNATMLYGHIETDADRVNHMLALRTLQDETRGFHSFVPLAYQKGGQSPFFSIPNGTSMRRNATGKKVTDPFTSGFLDLKVLSISRLMLDNVPHVNVHWPATDLKFAQAALSFGVDDIGGVNLQERVMRAAGNRQPEALSSAELVRFIKDAGYEPCLVDSSYSMSA